MDGVINPPESIDPETRPLFLQIQADHYQDAINETRARMNEIDNSSNVDDMGEYIELQERVTGLETARDVTLEQVQLEETKEQQEKDISRLQKFKEWAKENIAGLSALAISIAGIITTIIVGTRKAIIKGAQATSKFAKAVANIGKKLWPLLGPLLNILAQAISLGAKGLAWLSRNLWVPAIAFAWFLYDQFKQRRK